LEGCWGPPQIGEDRDTFKAVDALYTAVSLRDPNLLGQCETKLKELRGSSKTSDSAFSFLDTIIAESKGGKWEGAQERLSQFMEGQYR
jgi:hypothetical protein